MLKTLPQLLNLSSSSSSGESVIDPGAAHHMKTYKEANFVNWSGRIFLNSTRNLTYGAVTVFALATLADFTQSTALHLLTATTMVGAPPLLIWNGWTEANAHYNNQLGSKVHGVSGVKTQMDVLAKNIQEIVNQALALSTEEREQLSDELDQGLEKGLPLLKEELRQAGFSHGWVFSEADNLVAPVKRALERGKATLLQED